MSLLAFMLLLPTARALPQEDAAPVLKSIAQFHEMRRAGDPAVEDFLTDDFKFVKTTGILVNKDSFLTEIPYRPELNLKWGAIKIQRYGSAAVAYWGRSGKDGLSIVTQVWVQRGRRWKLAWMQRALRTAGPAPQAPKKKP